ncbi:MAG TPA: MltA domain-containing protein [Phycisphaerae bacterium]|nr:MltA domain-containing protein [Phycisphaerae bacterium]HOJ74934.1 MltA domain-containing protein [Phycisphaerae bacterium]HOM51495.1 MltA domain-containing protein [Phycisphaerae bacterium]HON68223.1 MltA domain-containing protein [Phycisphaerae bacterium]HOQ87259.1 MltA domain-containing protein [Phycisphaerae bacterium]
MLSIRAWVCVGLLSAIIISGCTKQEPPPIVEQEKDYRRPLPPGEKALVKLTDPAMFPDFGPGFEHKSGLVQAAMYSLDYLNKPSSQQFFPYLDITHERAMRSVQAFLDVLKESTSPEDFDAKIKERFDIYMSRGCDEKGTVLYTGYYRPIFDCRLQPDGEFRYPLYKKPPDLEQDPVTGQYHGPGGAPYLTRAQIEHGALAGKGLELCYLRDRFEAYIVTVQGSGKLRLPDGSFFEIGYAGDNGHDYNSVGQYLVNNGLIDAEDLSLQGLIAYFKANPDKLDEALAVNPRYVFFTPRSGGPYGCLNVPVTPYYSIATDKDIYPRACVSYMMTHLPARTSDGRITNHQYAGFAMDQDAGGAIRAAGRCDVFLGTGPEVGELAGRTYSEGQLYYIFVK